jgi:hypothetical protein
VRSESFFANPSLRAHLLLVSTGFTAAFLMVGAAALFLPLVQRFDAGTGSLDELGRLTLEILDLHARLWPVVFTALVSVAICSWGLYARMRAPLFRFVSTFRAISAGAIPEPIVIRATDYVQDESTELNAMLGVLKVRERERDAALERIEECAGALAEWASARGDAEALALAGALEAGCKALRPIAGPQ